MWKAYGKITKDGKNHTRTSPMTRRKFDTRKEAETFGRKDSAAWNRTEMAKRNHFKSVFVRAKKVGAPAHKSSSSRASPIRGMKIPRFGW